VSPRQFSLAGRTVKGRCVKPAGKNRHDRACRRAIALTISYGLNERDTVTFTITFMTTGRTVGGKCVAATKRNHTHKRCRRTVDLPGQIILSGNPGANSVAFDGKIGGRTLGVGSYLLTGTPAGGSPASTTFTIRR
jgi:hypothetical protein